MLRRFLNIVVAVLMLISMSLCIHAAEVPDPTHSGTITLNMEVGGDGIPGGMLALFRVGEISESDGNYSFVLTEEFTPSGQTLEDIRSSTLPGALADYAIFMELAPCQETEVDETGHAVFENVEPGLYLIIQTKPAEGYNPVNPFLVSLPVYEDGIYRYQVDATPKMSDLIPEETTQPTETTPTKPSEPTLPQTGQLNWPVPVLVTCGLGLFLLGWILCFGKRKEKYEE